ncbi:hypothetical protein [Metabacillus sp. FJAT-52054]|uniref:NERD domain-containing protein n=1 Tax=Metabacillus sediminis TaxID=3117746 RepID=A0ABZ2NFY8_9BACI
MTIIVIGIVLFLLFILYSKRKINELEKHCKTIGVHVDDVHDFDKVKLIDGLPLPLHSQCYLIMHKMMICIIHDNGKFVIENSQLIGAHKMTNKEILNTYRKKKSLIGRSLIGGLAFGGAGAVVGAISATNGGRENTVVEKDFLVITYRKSNYEVASLIFEEGFSTMSINRSVATINEKLVQKNPDRVTRL